MILELATYFSRKKLHKNLGYGWVFITGSLKRFSSREVKKHQNNWTETVYKKSSLFVIFHRKSYIFDNLDPLRIPIFLKRCNRRPGRIVSERRYCQVKIFLFISVSRGYTWIHVFFNDERKVCDEYVHHF